MNNNLNIQPILKCINITRSFQKNMEQVQVLKGINLEVFPGELIVIKGRSGEGKTVLQWILSGIDLPTTGEVLLGNVKYSNFSKEEISGIRRDKIGLVFQNFNLIQSWTALENVEAPLINSDLSNAARREKARNALTELGLGNRLNNLPVELSVGQQQRVALARALINDPLLIIADEPTGNVDDETASDMIGILLRHIKEKNRAMVVTTHGHFYGLHHANRIFELIDGILHDA